MADDRVLEETNEAAALNGGSARHWYQSEETESSPTPRLGAKIAVSLFVWGVVALGVVLLVAAL